MTLACAFGVCSGWKMTYYRQDVGLNEHASKAALQSATSCSSFVAICSCFSWKARRGTLDLVCLDNPSGRNIAFGSATKSLWKPQRCAIDQDGDGSSTLSRYCQRSPGSRASTSCSIHSFDTTTAANLHCKPTLA